MSLTLTLTHASHADDGDDAKLINDEQSLVFKELRIDKKGVETIVLGSSFETTYTMQ